MKESVANAVVVVSALTAVLALGMRLLDLGDTSRPQSLGPVVLTQTQWEEVHRDGHQLTRATRSPSTTIVYFTDFQCPYCARFEQHSLAGALEEFPGQLDVILRHWPLAQHQAAYPAAKAFECAASQGRTVEYHRALVESADTLSRTSLEALAKEAQVPNPIEFSECLRDTSIVKSIEADMGLAMSLEGLGTPLVIIDGTLFRAAPDSTTLARELRKRLSR
jgi:protein-disulfide isomerase